MKRSFLRLIVLQLIILSLTPMTFSVDGDEEGILTKLGTHIPELELMPIEQGIKSELNSNPDFIEGVISALKYINNITSTSKYWHSKKDLLKKILVKFVAPEYADLSKEELNEKLNEAMAKYLEAYENYSAKFSAENQGMHYITKRLMIAEKMSNIPEVIDIAKLIIAGANPNFEFKLPSASNSLLKEMIAHGNFNLIRLLIAYGTDVNRAPVYEEGVSIGYQDQTPLMNLVYGQYFDKENQRKLIELFIKRGADVNKADHSGLTALFYATLSGNVDAFETLLNFGVKPDDKTIEQIRSGYKSYEDRGYIDILKKYGYQI